MQFVVCKYKYCDVSRIGKSEFVVSVFVAAGSVAACAALVFFWGPGSVVVIAIANVIATIIGGLGSEIIYVSCVPLWA